MSDAVAKGKAALEADEGKLKKLLKAIKKLLAGEFLWALFIVVVSLPLALALEHVIAEYATGESIAAFCELIGGYSLFMGAYGISIAGLYFTRTIVGAIKTLTEKKE